MRVTDAIAGLPLLRRPGSRAVLVLKNRCRLRGRCSPRPPGGGRSGPFTSLLSRRMSRGNRTVGGRNHDPPPLRRGEPLRRGQGFPRRQCGVSRPTPAHHQHAPDERRKRQSDAVCLTDAIAGLVRLSPTAVRAGPSREPGFLLLCRPEAGARLPGSARPPRSACLPIEATERPKPNRPGERIDGSSAIASRARGRNPARSPGRNGRGSLGCPS